MTIPFWLQWVFFCLCVGASGWYFLLRPDCDSDGRLHRCIRDMALVPWPLVVAFFTLTLPVAMLVGVVATIVELLKAACDVFFGLTRWVTREK